MTTTTTETQTNAMKVISEIKSLGYNNPLGFFLVCKETIQHNLKLEGDFKTGFRYIGERIPENIGLTEIVSLSIKASGADEIFLSEIFALETGKGYGTMALDKITKIANKYGVTIKLTPEPLKSQPKTMNTTQLRKWYSKFGFKKQSTGNIYAYHPSEK